MDHTFRVEMAPRETRCSTKDCLFGGEIERGSLRIAKLTELPSGKSAYANYHAKCFLQTTLPRARFPFSLDDLSGMASLDGMQQNLLAGYFEGGVSFPSPTPPMLPPPCSHTSLTPKNAQDADTVDEQETTPAKGKSKASKATKASPKAKGGKAANTPARKGGSNKI